MPYWTHFTQKADISRLLAEKLRSGDLMEQDYVLQFCAAKWDVLSATPPTALDVLVATRLRAGDTGMRDALMLSFPWEDATWSASTRDARAEFKEADEIEGDDLPF